MGLVRIRGEVQVGEQQLAFAEHLALDRLGFFDLHDHVRGGKDLFGTVQDFGTCGRVVGIRETCTDAGTGLNDDTMAVGHGLLRGIGCHTDAKFLRFDFFRASDFHGAFSFWPSLGVMACKCLRFECGGLR